MAIASGAPVALDEWKGTHPMDRTDSDQTPFRTPGYSALAYPADALCVCHGVNLGEPIAGSGEYSLGDVYCLRGQSIALRLSLGRPLPDQTSQLIARGSDIGKEGDILQPGTILTLLATDGERVTIVTGRHEPSGRYFALPLSPLAHRADYTLVEVGDYSADLRLAEAICVSFAAGTLVTMAGGAQKVIEQLKIGDTVLTRDNGPQPVRWVGKATLRAKGSFAPVVISAGTLGNNGELVVSPHHRLFIYQRGDRRLNGRAEVLVQAKHLVDGDRVWRREGGFVDYYSLVFDRHEIIYAEGIPAESLMVNEDTVSLLPDDLATELRNRFPDLRHSQHFATEASRAILGRSGPSGLFRTE